MKNLKRKIIKIYLIARISPTAHSWNERVCSHIVNERIKVFIPHLHNPWNISHKKIPLAVVRADINQMRTAHFGLLLPPYGRDCAWEAGWFSHSSKVLIAFVHRETEWQQDWMLKGGLNYVITDNKPTYRRLRRDPVLNIRNVILLNHMKELANVIERIYVDKYVKKYDRRTKIRKRYKNE